MTIFYRLKPLQAYALKRKVYVVRVGKTYESWHKNDHSTTCIDPNIDEARMSVDQLARQHGTEPKARVTISLPPDAAQRLIKGINEKDPKLKTLIDNFGIKLATLQKTS